MLKKTNLRKTGLVAVALLLSAPVVADALRVCVDGNHPPFSAADEEGNLSGFDIDIARAVCDEMGLQCEWVRREWERLLPSLLSHECDAVVASLTPTKERKKQAVFTKPYYRNGVKFVRKSGDKGKISYKAMAGKTVGVRGGTLADDFLSKEFSGVNVARYPTLAQAHEALRQGKVDAVLADRFVQAAWAAENEGYQTAGPTYTKSKYFKDAAIAVRKDSKALRARLNDALQSLRAGGKYKIINDKYFSFNAGGN